MNLVCSRAVVKDLFVLASGVLEASARIGIAPKSRDSYIIRASDNVVSVCHGEREGKWAEWVTEDVAEK